MCGLPVAAIAEASRQLEGEDRAEAVSEEGKWPRRQWPDEIRESTHNRIEVVARRLTGAAVAARQLGRNDLDRLCFERARPSCVGGCRTAGMSEAAEPHGRFTARRNDDTPHLARLMH